MTRQLGAHERVLDLDRERREAVLVNPVRDVPRRLELPGTALDRDLPRGCGADEDDVVVVADRRSRLGSERRVVRVPPQERVRIEQEQHYSAKLSKPGGRSSKPGLTLILPARSPGRRS